MKIPLLTVVPRELRDATKALREAATAAQGIDTDVPEAALYFGVLANRMIVLANSFERANKLVCRPLPLSPDWRQRLRSEVLAWKVAGAVKWGQSLAASSAQVQCPGGLERVAAMYDAMTKDADRAGEALAKALIGWNLTTAPANIREAGKYLNRATSKGRELARRIREYGNV